MAGNWIAQHHTDQQPVPLDAVRAHVRQQARNQVNVQRPLVGLSLIILARRCQRQFCHRGDCSSHFRPLENLPRRSLLCRPAALFHALLFYYASFLVNAPFWQGSVPNAIFIEISWGQKLPHSCQEPAKFRYTGVFQRGRPAPSLAGHRPSLFGPSTLLLTTRATMSQAQPAAAAQFRIEKDSMGDVQVPAQAYYGAQTQRAVDNFPVSGWQLPPALIHAMGLVKLACATANRDLGKLTKTGKNKLDDKQVEALSGRMPRSLRREVRLPVPDRCLPDRLGHQQQHERQRGDLQSGD